MAREKDGPARACLMYTHRARVPVAYIRKGPGHPQSDKTSARGVATRSPRPVTIAGREQQHCISANHGGASFFDVLCTSGVGVGRGDRRLHCWVRTPPRKIRHQFQKCKHTSLTSVLGEVVEIHRRFIALCFDGSYVAYKGDAFGSRNGCRNVWETVVP
jgi:hypothetical protein